MRLFVESTKTYAATNARGERVHVQAYALDGVLNGVRQDEGLAEYAIEDAQGIAHLIWADGPARAVDLMRFALRRRPKGEPVLVGPCELHPDCH